MMTTEYGRDNTSLWFYLICTIHLFFWTLVPTLLRQNLRTDTMENLGLGRMWQMGYAKHPPLAQWLTAFVTDLFGTIGWPVYFLGQLCVVITFYAIWRLARHYLTPLAALTSVILLEGIYFYHLEATQFNQNVLMLPLWSLSYLTFYHALTRNKLIDWVGLGIFAGLAILAKYESALLLVAILGVLITTSQGRQAFKSYGLYLSFLIGFLIIMPNIIWLVNHDFASFHYLGDRFATEDTAHLSSISKRIIYPLTFIAEELGAVIPLILLFFGIFWWRSGRDSSHCITSEKFNYSFLMILFFVPILLPLLLSLISGSWLHSLWAYPFFSLLGILLLVIFQIQITPSKLKLSLIVIGSLWGVLAIMSAADLYAKPYFTGKTNSQHIPAKQIADDLTQEWNSKFHQPLSFIGSNDRIPMLNIFVLSHDHPIPYYAWGNYPNAWVNDQDVKHKGAIFVWENDCHQFPAAEKFPDAIIQSPHFYNYLTKAKVEPMKLCVAFLTPKIG